MPKFAYHSCDVLEKAQVVLFGVPDESGNQSNRRGASKGPAAIRKASVERLTFARKDGQHVIVAQHGEFCALLHDAGDVKKKKVQAFVSGLSAKQMPVVLGGDHSISYEVIAGLGEHHKKLAIIYLDAHPDIICSTSHYYGSVVCDLFDLPHVDAKKIVEVGIRSIEAEEKVNLATKKILSFTSLDVAEDGVAQVFSAIKKRIGNTPVYLSIDLDVLDPAFAPGVDTPVPFGLSSVDFLRLVKRCACLNLVGFDIMEMSPPHDIQQKTAQLAAQTIIEILAERTF